MEERLTPEEVYARGLKEIGQEYWAADGKHLLTVMSDACAHALVRYILEGAPLGSFLRAVVENDFMEVLKTADEHNEKILKVYGVFLHNYAPSQCFGSKATYSEWRARGGILGESSGTCSDGAAC